MKNLKIDTQNAEKHQSPDVAEMPSRRNMLIGLGGAMLASPFLTLLDNKIGTAYGKETILSSVKQNPLNTAELHCSEFARNGGYFVGTNLFDFVRDFNFNKSIEYKLLNSDGEIVYQYDIVLGQPQSTPAPSIPIPGAILPPRPPRRSNLLFQLSAKDNQGRTALLRIETADRINEIGMIPVLRSINLRLAYFVPGTATAPPQSESVQLNSITENSDIRNALTRPGLFAQILNPTLLGEMINPNLLAGLLVDSSPQVVAAERKSCLSCFFYGAAIVATAGVAAAAFVGAVVLTGAAAIASTGAGLTATAGAFKMLSDFVEACKGACSD